MQSFSRSSCFYAIKDRKYDIVFFLREFNWSQTLGLFFTRRQITDSSVIARNVARECLEKFLSVIDTSARKLKRSRRIRNTRWKVSASARNRNPKGPWTCSDHPVVWHRVEFESAAVESMGRDARAPARGASGCEARVSGSRESNPEALATLIYTSGQDQQPESCLAGASHIYLSVAGTALARF